MRTVARLVGVLVAGLALAGLVAALLVDLRGQSGPFPHLNAWGWTAALRAVLEYASFLAVGWAGVSMARNLSRSSVPLAVAIAAAALRIGYDWLVWTPEDERLAQLLRTDLHIAVLVTLALFACLVAQDEEAALAARRQGFAQD